LQNSNLKFGIMSISYTRYMQSNFREKQHINGQDPVQQVYKIWRKNFHQLLSNHIFGVGSFFKAAPCRIDPDWSGCLHWQCMCHMAWCQKWCHWLLPPVSATLLISISSRDDIDVIGRGSFAAWNIAFSCCNAAQSGLQVVFDCQHVFRWPFMLQVIAVGLGRAWAWGSGELPHNTMLC